MRAHARTHARTHARSYKASGNGYPAPKTVSNVVTNPGGAALGGDCTTDGDNNILTCIFTRPLATSGANTITLTDPVCVPACALRGRGAWRVARGAWRVGVGVGVGRGAWGVAANSYFGAGRVLLPQN